MGKNKKQQEHRKKGKVENEEEDILTEVSEFLGIPVWEVTKADVKKYKRDNGIEDDDEDEGHEEEEEEEEEEAEEEQIKEDKKTEDAKEEETKGEEIKEEDTKTEDEVKETTDLKEETTTIQQSNPQTQAKPSDTESSLKIPKALNNNDTPLQNDSQYPIVTILSPNVTKITTDIDYTDSMTYLGDTVPSLPSTFLNEIPSSSEASTKSHIQFLPIKHIYEYPKEDSKQSSSSKPIHKKQKAKDNDNHINVRQSKKEAKVKSSDDLDED